MISFAFKETKRAQKGRRALRHLDDSRIAAAKIKSDDIKHQMKFMSPMKRFATALSLAS